MSHLIDILSCIIESVFQLKLPFSVIAQEINRINGGLVLKPKLLCVTCALTISHFRWCSFPTFFLLIINIHFFFLFPFYKEGQKYFIKRTLKFFSIVTIKVEGFEPWISLLKILKNAKQLSYNAHDHYFFIKTDLD